MDEKIYPDIVVHVRALLSHTLIDQSNVDKDNRPFYIVQESLQFHHRQGRLTIVFFNEKKNVKKFNEFQRIIECVKLENLRKDNRI